jgi:hypothetical protein
MSDTFARGILALATLALLARGIAPEVRSAYREDGLGVVIICALAVAAHLILEI